MTKISFLQSEYEDKLGVLYLITYLQSKGHSAELFIEMRHWLELRKTKNFYPEKTSFWQ